MASSPSAGSPGTPPSKLPRFLQKQTQRDRSKSDSVSDSKQRKSSKFASIHKPTEPAVDEPPIIVEPPPAPVDIPSPRPRTRSERPVASAPETQHINLYASGSPSRIGDLPTRLSGWFAHTFSSSSTDLSLPTILAQHSRGSSPSGYDSSSSHASPARKLFSGPAALLAAAKHGRDKAMLYLLDSDAVPDRCGAPIWLLGVQHPGWEGPPLDVPRPPTPQRKIKGRRGSWRSSSSSAASSSADGHSSPSSVGHSSTTSATANGPRPPPDPGAAWPPAFYADFTSRIWLTYRSNMSTPIRDGRLAELPPCSPPFSVSSFSIDDSQSPTAARKVWPWAGEKTWSADTGWGCMLRTGQSLLANALVGVHLGRDWRRPPHPVATPEYATYVRILTWFLDTPSPHAPFSVHRMALAGKELGTDVGQWFGPSVAAGAIKTLVSAFPECGLSVALAVDGTLYQSSVFAASHGDASRVPRRQHTVSWGERPVLILLGIRLGIEGVNPIYYETIKMLYTFPQSVGIAGGRPSSSYYFVGCQQDALFYLDPHNPRPAVRLRPPPELRLVRERVGRGGEREREMTRSLGRGVDEGAGVRRRPSESESEGGRRAEKIKVREEVAQERKQAQDADHHESPRRSGHSVHVHSPSRTTMHQKPQSQHVQQTPHRQRTTTTTTAAGAAAPVPAHPRTTPASPSSVKTGSSNFSYHAPASPSPLQVQFSTESHASRVSRASDASKASQVSSVSRTSRASRASDADADGEGSVGDSYVYDYGEGEDEGYGEDADADKGYGEGEDEDARSPPPVYDQHRGDRYAGGGAGGPFSGGRARRPPSSNQTARFDVDSTTRPNLDPVQLHYINAYGTAELRTFHCERVRKMPLSGLDPSMLIGFVCRDEGEWKDFRRRVGELPKTIFSIEDEHPNWPSDLDDDMGLESISEPDPDDLDLEDEEDEERAVVVGVDPEGDEDGDGDEQFFDTHEGPGEGSGSGLEERPRGTGHGQGHGHRHDLSKGTRRSTDTSDDDEDPADPVTPGPTGRFEIRVPVPPRAGAGKGKGRMGDDVVQGGDGEGSDIEDDWIDPSVPTPAPMGASLEPQVVRTDRELPPLPPPKDKDKDRDRDRDRRATPLSSSSTSSKHGSSSTSTGKSRKSAASSSSTTTTSSSGRKASSAQVPVPVPKVRVSHRHGRHHHQQQEPQEHYPFPVAPSDDSLDAGSSRRERERERTQSTALTLSTDDEEEEDNDDGEGGGGGGEGRRRRTKTQTQLSHSHSHHSHSQQHGGGPQVVPLPSHRMHNGRARDGGRTQSGGVKAILTDS